MTNSTGQGARAGREALPPALKIVRSSLRATGSTVALVALYYLLPLDTSVTWFAVTMLVIGLVVLAALVTFYVRWIIRSPFPGLRAIEALAISIPLFLLLFAATYVVLDTESAANFSQPLTRTDAVYFTVTVFSTVGFGDITAKTEIARLVVIIQMIGDLIVLGLGIKVIVGAVTRGRQQRSADESPVQPDR
jgi:voltage-gated potassium channel